MDQEPKIAKFLGTRSIEDEIRQSYLDYAMSVIVGRALPDVRDGLKPVHRRVLYAMHELRNDFNKPYKKSARIVGDVIGKYHPHGDTPVYDTIVRMAQPFSLRYMLVEGQGNFGSIDGDAPAAMRYTEVRLRKLAHTLLEDIDKNTVDFVDNYDGSEQMPAVLPARFPNLLVNGSTGIAVGMATNIPPHNIGESIDATVALLDDPDIDTDALIAHIKGPDFPTAGIINGRAGLINAYKTGRGRAVMRGRYHIEPMPSDRERLVFTEIPYQVNKAKLVEKIATLVKEKRISSISELRDESDKDGIRIVMELKRGEAAQILVNHLFELTPLQSVFGINMVSLVNGRPVLLNLKRILELFLRHRREVVTRRTEFELRKARESGHLLEGLVVAIANIDEIIESIKTAPSVAEARVRLLDRQWPASTVLPMLQALGPIDSCRPEGLEAEYGFQQPGDDYRLSPAQANAILEMRLQKLTGLEQEKLTRDYQAIISRIADLLDILQNPERLRAVIREELIDNKTNFADARRTEIVETQEDISLADLIEQQMVMLTISKAGWAKIQPLTNYQSQHRGGRGKQASLLKDDDYIQRMLTVHSHDTVLLFSSAGKVYWLKVFQFPTGSRNSKGKPLINILPLGEDERITAVLPLPDSRNNTIKEYEFAPMQVLMCTRRGIVKKTPLSEFSRPRPSGIIALELEEGDSLIGALLTSGDSEVVLCSSGGKIIRFPEQQVRPMGRIARGVIGMRMGADERIVAMLEVGDQQEILTASSSGYGKRSEMSLIRAQARGGQGVRIQRLGAGEELIGAIEVTGDDADLCLITQNGILVRTAMASVRQTGRDAKGVTLIRLQADDKLITIDGATAEEALESDTEDEE